MPAGTNVEAARKLLEQAEHGCLIANSLRSARSLRRRCLWTITERIEPNASELRRNFEFLYPLRCLNDGKQYRYSGTG